VEAEEATNAYDPLAVDSAIAAPVGDLNLDEARFASRFWRLISRTALTTSWGSTVSMSRFLGTTIQTPRSELSKMPNFLR